MIKILIHWILAAFTIMATAHLVPGFFIENFSSALVASLVLGVLNVLVWPLLALLTLPITVLTLGLFIFVLNALVLKFGAALVSGFEIVGIWPAIWGGIAMTILSWLVKLLFGGSKDEDA